MTYPTAPEEAMTEETVKRTRKANPILAATREYSAAKAEFEKIERKWQTVVELGAHRDAAINRLGLAKEALDKVYNDLTA